MHATALSMRTVADACWAGTQLPSLRGSCFAGGPENGAITCWVRCLVAPPQWLATCSGRRCGCAVVTWIHHLGVHCACLGHLTRCRETTAPP